MDVCTTTPKFFRDVIGVHYSPQVGLPEDPMDSDNEVVTLGMRETVNPIDKGIFPPGFVSLSTGHPFAA